MFQHNTRQSNSTEIGTDTKMYGVVEGAQFTNQRRSAELNERISVRNLPSAPLQQHFSIRPVSTKYDMMSIIDRRAKPSVPIQRVPTHNVATNFNPGTAQAPWEGFASNINDESTLRNQFFAIQNCEQAVYVPSSKSDLYEVKVGGRQEMQPHNGLFEEPDLAPFNPNPDMANVGHNMFHNNTREQVKNL